MKPNLQIHRKIPGPLPITSNLDLDETKTRNPFEFTLKLLKKLLENEETV